MAELANCSRCDTVFAKNMRDICQVCYREEEKAFEVVYRFLIKRENREATLLEIIRATDVEEALIIKFIKENRLRTSQFPKLAYPCEKCEEPIIAGRLCNHCAQDLIGKLEQHEKTGQQKREKEKGENSISIYHAIGKHRN